MALLEINDLRVSFGAQGARNEVVSGVSFAVDAGRTLAVVGESGSGKSVSLLAATGLLGPGAEVTGSVRFDGREILHLDARQLRALRGARIGYVSQDPSSNLHPLKRIGVQIAEAIRVHRPLRARALRARVIELLTEVGIRDPERRIDDYPWQLSGGMRQRVMIAMAIALNPQLVIADEPTTALDVTVQASIMRLLRQLQARHGTALVFVSHDLALVSDIADHLVVMQRGHVRESGEAQAVYREPSHPYTQQLLEASLPLRAPLRPSAPAATPLLRVEAVSRVRTSRSGWRSHARTVLDAVSFDLHEGEILGLVGESGSGKSTIGRIVAGFDRPDGGRVLLDGDAYAQAGRGAPRLQATTRRAIQMVFQDPYGSLNPRQRVATVLAEPFILQRKLTAARIEQEVAALAQRVGLPHELLERFPAQLSGGQRQRVAIARAVALQPRVVVADEPVSALDLTTQRHIVALLRSLRDALRVSFLFISHDLAVVGELCDRVLVLDGGRIVETGPAREVLAHPQHPYTRKLVDSIPGRGQLFTSGLAELDHV
ncbi:peptide/nickel transport system ATP-binding protein [Paraburkholderia unamae]|uniref:dipeptide ABC transporter ATP-binding protein n=1 Tax=Paraburkholderia unamae TaxID=219649 RepID=UPI000DC3F21E|nr:ABC transporter ATP-binding protein [Paraburkholderia unamae]RAR62594.1 peptide/nickel transport system ATP-binding protein [Paraburkholderia unamae]